MPDGVPGHLLTRIEATCFFLFSFLIHCISFVE